MVRSIDLYCCMKVEILKMVIADNFISVEQWKVILTAFKLHCASIEVDEKEEVYYIDEETCFGDVSKQRVAIYDNLDRYSSPALDFIVDVESGNGKLYVYNGSEQARAPIDFENGLKIAKTFFTYAATELSESIVCNYIMSKVN